jgi:ABC-2 type transport system permease protein
MSATHTDNAPETLPWRRVLYWSMRRELWENRAILVAPLVIAGVGLVGAMLSTIGLPAALRALEAGTGKPTMMVMGPYSFIALAVLVTGMLVALFYCLGALQGERRDRSLLFWKSLPVSDWMTVLSKAAVPTLVTPAVTFVAVFAAQAAFLVWSLAVTAMNGLSPALLLKHADLSTMWVVLPYGLLVNGLWQAPVVAWLLLVSAWARRMPILWALAPFAVPAIIEGIAFRTAHVATFIGERVLGGFALAFSADGKAQTAIHSISQINPGRVLAESGLWLGLLFAAGFLAAAVALRRRREPT